MVRDEATRLIRRHRRGLGAVIALYVGVCGVLVALAVWRVARLR